MGIQVIVEPDYAKLQDIAATAEREAPLTIERWQALFDEATVASAGFPVTEFMFEFLPEGADEDDGDTEKVEKRISGNSDIPLNDKGEKLAKELGERLAAKGGLDRLASSTLMRATQTADAIVAADEKVKLSEPEPALCPWRLGEYEGMEPKGIRKKLDALIENPDTRPPGEGADGREGETFNEAKKRQLDFLAKIYFDWANDPDTKVGVVMHSRGMELLRAWVDEGCPADYDLDQDDLLNPDDPDHATVLRWHEDKVKEVNLESDKDLKPGVYLILHSLTDDDGDAGNKDLEKYDSDQQRDDHGRWGEGKTGAVAVAIKDSGKKNQLTAEFSNGGKPIGHVNVFTDLGGGKARLESLEIQPEFRGQGNAVAGYESLMTALQERGFSEMLSSNMRIDGGQAVWERLQTRYPDAIRIAGPDSSARPFHLRESGRFVVDLKQIAEKFKKEGRSDDGAERADKRAGEEDAGAHRESPGQKVNAGQKYLPPIEVNRAAKRAWDLGSSVIGITCPLAEGEGIGLTDVWQIANHFAAVAKTGCPESSVVRDAWGGEHAARWAERVFKKVAQEIGKYLPDQTVKADGEIAKAGSGVMLAFWPDAKTQRKLAVEGGEEADSIHITLAYFGKPSEMEPGCLEALDHWMKGFTASHAPVSGTVTGIGIFPATPQSDGQDVAYRGFHSDAIQEFRRELVEAAEAAGCKPRKNFGYNPHVTVKYLSPAAPHLLGHPDNVNVTFDKVVLSVAGEKTEYPLVGEKTLADYVAAKEDAPEPDDFTIEGDITKLDEERHLVFGWASVTEIHGKIVTDTQGDRIKEATVEAAAYDYVLNARVAGHMHEDGEDGEAKEIGRLVESVVFTKEKQEAMLQSLKTQGINAELNLGCIAWWIGFKVQDSQVWADIKAGKLKAFSVGGKGKRAACEEEL